MSPKTIRDLKDFNYRDFNYKDFNYKDINYKEQTSKAVSKMYKKVSDYSDVNAGKGRGMAAETVASLLSTGMVKLGDGKNNESDGMTTDNINDLDDENMDRSSNFVDSLMERVIKHTIPYNSTKQDEELKQRIHDPERVNKPSLSIKILTSNFKRLSSQMTLLFKIQYGIIHVITWKKPSKTLTALVLYTSICIWPHLALAYPLIFILYGILVPAYLERHPMRTPELIKVRKRGQSLWDFLNQSNESSIAIDLMHRNNLGYYDDNREFSLLGQPTEQEELTDDDDDEKKVKKNKKDKSKYINSQIALLVNMRDLQNLMTDLLDGINTVERFWYQTASFQDEKLTTSIFYGIIAAVFCVLFFGKFIPWKFIFIQLGWGLILLCHPNSKKIINRLGQTRQPRNTAQKEMKQINKSKEISFQKDILVDEAPECRTVEIFELNVKDLISGEWKFHLYSDEMFDLADPDRIAAKRPHGVEKIQSVLAPTDWTFEAGLKNKWKVDTFPQKFILERGIKNDTLIVNPHETEGWIYDAKTENINSDILYEFRRRRLYRESYRHARPARKPHYT